MRELERPVDRVTAEDRAPGARPVFPDRREVTVLDDVAVTRRGEDIERRGQVVLPRQTSGSSRKPRSRKKGASSRS